MTSPIDRLSATCCLCAKQNDDVEPIIAHPVDETGAVGLSLILKPFDKTVEESKTAERQLQESESHAASHE